MPCRTRIHSHRSHWRRCGKQISCEMSGFLASFLKSPEIQAPLAHIPTRTPRKPLPSGGHGPAVCLSSHPPSSPWSAWLLSWKLEVLPDEADGTSPPLPRMREWWKVVSGAEWVVLMSQELKSDVKKPLPAARIVKACVGRWKENYRGLHS